MHESQYFFGDFIDFEWILAGFRRFFEARNLKNPCFSSGKSLFFQNPRFAQKLAEGPKLMRKCMDLGMGLAGFWPGDTLLGGSGFIFD